MSRREITKRLEKLESRQPPEDSPAPDQIMIVGVDSMTDEYGRVWIRECVRFPLGKDAETREREREVPSLEEEPWRLRDDHQ